MGITRLDRGNPSVLVIESDPLMLTAIGSVLDMQGHRVVLARTETVATEALAQRQFDLILLSIDELQQGCRFAARLRGTEATRDVPVIFLSPLLSAQWTAELAAHGGVYCMLKPAEPYALLELVESTLSVPHFVPLKGEPRPPVHFTAQADWVKLS